HARSVRHTARGSPAAHRAKAPSPHRPYPPQSPRLADPARAAPASPAFRSTTPDPLWLRAQAARSSRPASQIRRNLFVPEKLPRPLQSPPAPDAQAVPDRPTLPPTPGTESQDALSHSASRKASPPQSDARPKVPWQLHSLAARASPAFHAP